VTALRLVPVVLSTLLLAAHFLRSGHGLAVLLVLLSPLLLVLRRTWSTRALQLVLILGALEWLRTLLVLARLRAALDQPWLRMAAILAVVALVAVLGALSLEARPLRQRFRSRQSDPAMRP
jgi:hypothetical protein